MAEPTQLELNERSRKPGSKKCAWCLAEREEKMTDNICKKNCCWVEDKGAPLFKANPVTITQPTIRAPKNGATRLASPARRVLTISSLALSTIRSSSRPGAGGGQYVSVALKFAVGALFCLGIKGTY